MHLYTYVWLCGVGHKTRKWSMRTEKRSSGEKLNSAKEYIWHLDIQGYLVVLLLG